VPYQSNTSLGYSSYIKNASIIVSEILHALETSMNLKILILPNGPNNKNCFCTCDNTATPKIIPVSALPAQIADIAAKKN
jgi:hypothetical protein